MRAQDDFQTSGEAKNGEERKIEKTGNTVPSGEKCKELS